MTSFPQCLKLKELGLEQIGDGGWYCPDCEKEFEEVGLKGFRVCKCEDWASKPGFAVRTNNVSIPSTDQMFQAVEELEHCIAIDYVPDSRDLSYRLIYKKEVTDNWKYLGHYPDNLSALISLYIELKEGK